MASEDDLSLEVENVSLRRLLAQAGIHAAEQKVAERLQRVLLEELHHRVKNTLATVLAITSQSLRTAESLEHSRKAPVLAPSHRSFGSRLIEHSFVSQLQGKANLAFEASGVVCTLDVPLAVVKPLQ